MEQEELSNREVEEALLGSCIASPALFQVAYEIVDEGCFSFDQTRAVWSVLKQHSDADKLISVASVAAYYMNNPRWDDYIRALVDCGLPVESSVRGYCLNLLELKRRRSVVSSYRGAIRQLIEQRPDEPLEEIISAVDMDLINIGMEEDATSIRSCGDVADAALKHIELCMKGGGDSGITSGYSAIDRILHGFLPADFVILAGRPGMGKTALALCMAAKQAHHGKAVAFFSPEMPSEQLMKRLQSVYSGVPQQDMLKGNITEADFDALFSATEAIKRLPITFHDKQALTIPELLSAARKLRRAGKCDVVYVDYIQLMKASDTAYRQGAYQSVSEISKSLKGIAKKLGIPVVGLAQLSRAVESREDKRPQLSDLRESGQLEQDADRVIFLYREEYYLQRQGEPQQGSGDGEKHTEKVLAYHSAMERAAGVADVIVAKNRHGPIGTAQLRFNAELVRFEEA